MRECGTTGRLARELGALPRRVPQDGRFEEVTVRGGFGGPCMTELNSAYRLTFVADGDQRARGEVLRSYLAGLAHGADACGGNHGSSPYQIRVSNWRSTSRQF